MRRSASEIIRNLEQRIARLEKSSAPIRSEYYLTSRSDLNYDQDITIPELLQGALAEIYDVSEDDLDDLEYEVVKSDFLDMWTDEGPSPYFMIYDIHNEGIYTHALVKKDQETGLIEVLKISENPREIRRLWDRFFH